MVAPSTPRHVLATEIRPRRSSKGRPLTAPWSLLWPRGRTAGRGLAGAVAAHPDLGSLADPDRERRVGVVGYGRAQSPSPGPASRASRRAARPRRDRPRPAPGGVRRPRPRLPASARSCGCARSHPSHSALEADGGPERARPLAHSGAPPSKLERRLLAHTPSRTSRRPARLRAGALLHRFGRGLQQRQLDRHTRSKSRQDNPGVPARPVSEVPGKDVEDRRRRRVAKFAQRTP